MRGKTPRRRIRLTRAAIWGLVVGVLATVVDPTFWNDLAGVSGSHRAGMIVGRLIAGPLIFMGIAALINRFRRGAAAAPDEPDGERAGEAHPHGSVRAPKGIAGWLLLPAIYTFAFAILGSIGAYDVTVMLKAYEKAHEGPISLPYAIAHVAVAANQLMAAAWVLAAVRLVRKDPRYPTLFCGIFFAQSVWFVAYELVAWAIFGKAFTVGDGMTLVTSVAGCAIGIPYMRRSKRVANTFVARPRPEPAPQPDLAAQD